MSKVRTFVISLLLVLACSVSLFAVAIHQETVDVCHASNWNKGAIVHVVDVFLHNAQPKTAADVAAIHKLRKQVVATVGPHQECG